MNITGLSGSLTSPSRTTVLVSGVVAAAQQALHGRTELLSIAELGPALAGATNLAQLPEAVCNAQQKLIGADLLVIGTPIYKAAYTGLLKHFFDLLDPDCLRGKVAILAATGGSEHHALVLEHQLRPLLSFFGVYTAPTTLFARDEAFTKDETGTYRLIDETLHQRIRLSVEQASSLLGHSPIDVRNVA